MISPSLYQWCNFPTQSSREVLGVFPSLLKNPNRCADEIGSRSRNPQIFIKNKNIILLQLAEILEKGSANACASALRKSRMNKKARSHVQQR